MYRTRMRKILGDVWARKGRTALVSMAIFIGVAGVIALSSMGDILVGQLEEDLKEDELSMLEVFVTANAGAALDDAAYIERLSNEITGITDVLGFANATAFYKLAADEEDFREGFINAYTIPYEANEGRLPIEPKRLIEGEYPVEGENQVVIDQRMADDLDLSVGDTLFFRVLSPSIREETLGETGTTEAFTISGILFDPYAESDRFVYSASIDEANYITAGNGLSGFSARFVDFPTAEAQVDNVTNLIANQTPYRPVFPSLEDPAQNGLIQTAQTLSLTMTTLAFIALVVSGFLVVNVISAIVIEQKRQIGVMKSIGATRADSFFMYSGIAFAYGVIGVIPGVLVGIWGGNLAANALAPTLNTVLDGFQVSTGSVILGVVVGLVIPVLAAMLPVYLGTRVNILEAMTDLGIDSNYGHGPIARVIGWLPVPITVRQGLSNVSLKKSRLAFTMIVLAIAAGAFMGIFAVFNSVTGGLDIFFNSFNIEVAVIPNQGRDPDEIVTFIEDNFAVIEAIEPGFQLPVQFEGYEAAVGTGGPPAIFAYGYDVNSPTPPVNYALQEGAALTEENAAEGVIFSSLLATNMDKAVGDRVVMEVPGNSVELTIVGIAEFPLDQIWIDWRVLAQASRYFGTTNIESPLPIPEEATNFINYLNEVEVGGSTIAGVGLRNEVVAGFAPLVTEGEIFTRGEAEVVISSGLAESRNLRVGDTLPVISMVETGMTLDYTVTGIIELPATVGGGVFPTEFITTDWENLVQLDGLTLEGTPIPQAYFLTTTIENITSEEAQEITRDIDELLLANGTPSQVVNFVAQIDAFSESFVTIQIVLQAVALLIALVGALGLLTTLFMSVFERQKEIGVMRSIGASSSTVVSQFLTEGLVVGFIAWLVGIPLAIAIQMLLLNVTGFDETFPATFPIEGVVIGLIGMLLITVVASIWPSLSAARRTVSDILRYQ